MKPDYLLAFLQYLVCLVTGVIYFIGIATVLGVAAGFGPLGLLFLFLPLLLGGFVSGFALFRPRIAAGLAIVMVLPFIASAIYLIIHNIPASEPALWMIPGCVVIFIATLSLLFVRHSLWQGSKPVRILAVILAILPALGGIVFLGSSVLWIASLEWKLN